MELIEIVPLGDMTEALVAELGSMLAYIIGAYLSFVAVAFMVKEFTNIDTGPVYETVTADEWREIRAARRNAPRERKLSKSEWKSVRAARGRNS